MTDAIHDVIIIGGGASGLLCTRECARRGLKTVILDKEPLVGRKILASGHGRCNLTNTRVSPAYYHADPALISATLSQFSYEDCHRYFEQLGVLLTEEENGRIFPATGKATAVLEPLKLAATESAAEILTSHTVTHIKRAKLFTVQTKEGPVFQTRNVVLACGSCAYPQVSGSSGGYELARTLGHHITPLRPALSGLCLQENFSRLAGIRAQVKLHVSAPNAVPSEGEIIFTNYGINGPAALNVSSAISRELQNGPVHITLNFLPRLTDATSFWEERLKIFANRKPKDFFAGVLHESLANLLIDFKGLRKNKPMSAQFPSAVKQALETVHAWPATVTALRPWNEAMVAAGGVNLKEINYNTFESLLCPHLYIIGELLDVDGQSGGFNLHFAWASGLIAAKHLAQENKA